MKIIIFLVLAGLSLAQEEINCPEPPTPKDKKECLIEAFKEGSNFTKSYTKYMCEYRGKFEDNRENHDKAARDAFMTMACAGCVPDDFLATGKTFEEILENTGKLEAEILIIAEKIADILGLTEGVFNVICNLVGDVLASECTERILKDNTPGLIKTLVELFCKNDPKALSVDQMIDLLSNIGCFGDDALHTKDILEKLLKGSGENLKTVLTGVIDTIKDLLVQKGLVSDLTCDLTEVVSGEDSMLEFDGVVGGGGRGLLLLDPNVL
ncbi:uncharacterized protein LOC130282153 [Hyla sarda]|uniref:uncharacterized protein LOC130282153 n=1 Tax=Hyla sarda TaxID=327740 RepID=UPI0024C41964|nr:uncharacterized protein LOC130282153 [Hyla sarda]